MMTHTKYYYSIFIGVMLTAISMVPYLIFLSNNEI